MVVAAVGVVVAVSGRWWVAYWAVGLVLVVALVRVSTGYVAWHACGYGPMASAVESVGHLGAGPGWLECAAGSLNHTP